MTRVMAQGVFDILHPGHIYYLEESAKLGDELYVVIARDSRVKERKDLVMNERERLALVDALEVVNEARLGTEEDIYDILGSIRPNILTIGHDQPYDIEEIKEQQEQRGYYDIDVRRIDEYELENSGIVSSSEIKQLLRERQQ